MFFPALCFAVFTLTCSFSGFPATFSTPCSTFILSLLLLLQLIVSFLPLRPFLPINDLPILSATLSPCLYYYYVVTRVLLIFPIFALQFLMLRKESFGSRSSGFFIATLIYSPMKAFLIPLSCPAFASHSTLPPVISLHSTTFISTPAMTGECHLCPDCLPAHTYNASHLHSSSFLTRTHWSTIWQFKEGGTCIMSLKVTYSPFIHCWSKSRGPYTKLRVASALNSVLAFEPVADKNSLPQDTRATVAARMPYFTCLM